ncbi:hypothetical protein RRG08_037788 [Elysia crispata]|uniref:Uncharacterized protein n=1 Tax=Elysia crispata TaxID=231223 RepID=A0AAE1EE44_9GAST|nr:hypothetical protein RRG08_037788 [Elysia crispata]
MALASSQFQEFVVQSEFGETSLPAATQGKGGKQKGKLPKRSDGSFSDSSNSFIRQQSAMIFRSKTCEEEAVSRTWHSWPRCVENRTSPGASSEIDCSRQIKEHTAIDSKTRD